METIKKQIIILKEEFIQALTKVETEQDLEQIRVLFLGRQGNIAALINQFKKLSIAEKKLLGPELNQLKTDIQERYEDKKEEIEQLHAAKKIGKKRYFDVTASLYQELQPSLHIYTQIIEQLENVFISMGYDIVDGPEVESDYYNFEALNIPPHHPARDLQDTFWLDVSDKLLRTQTSSVQARIMKTKKLPLAAFSPGRCYRNEATDASHDFMFTQAEALFIDKNVSVAHLLATARTFLQTIFEKKDLKIRVRPGYFPFVEPGLEIDASCPFCKTGCSVCKKTTWIELLGSGLVHPNVLRAGNIDPNIYSGFAFGLGIERLAMLKYGINDIRLFHSSKITFLDQFR
ncbi:MAG: phenylalanine--tRNA ligase subunit alpha [Candidatus Babeliales bacterium]